MRGQLVQMLRSADPRRELPDELEPSLSALVARAVAAWPGVNVDADRFIRAIAERMPADRSPAAALEALHTDDLYLACGCAAGDRVALAGFEARYGRVIERAIVAVGVSAADGADLGQIVRARLLVGSGNGALPRISTYSASGSLAAWVRVVAARETYRLVPRVQRERRRRAADDELANLAASSDDPEVGYLKRMYREEFKQAIHAAVASLEARDRLLLRQYALDGLTIDQLAALHGVHRATAARQVQAARAAVLSRTRWELTRRLRLTPREIISMMRLIRSQLDISLSRALAMRG